jgi:hypothetical protein
MRVFSPRIVSIMHTEFDIITILAAKEGTTPICAQVLCNPFKEAKIFASFWG